MIVYSTRYLGPFSPFNPISPFSKHWTLILLRRYILELRLPLQHHLQAPLPRLPILHHLPHAQRLQTHPRPQHRHFQSAIPTRWQRRSRHPLPLQIPNHRSMRPPPFHPQTSIPYPSPPLPPKNPPQTNPTIDPLGLLHLARIRRHPPPTLHAPTHRRSRNHNNALSLRAGYLPRFVHSELAIQVFCRGVYRSDRVGGGAGADGAVFGLFLDLLY